MKKLCFKLCFGSLLAAPLLAAAVDSPTAFTNQGSVINTRHNMTQAPTGLGANMNSSRNNYVEVCVYCHTPHGASSATAAPLWNRLLPNSATYTNYTSATISGTVNNPGAASLTCLSCHDGSQAVDSALNMPGSGQYSATADSTTFVPLIAAGQSKSAAHYGFEYRRTNAGVVTTGTNQGCEVCHSAPGGLEVASDFSIAFIGKDLRNDHPVGVAYPAVTGGGTDWNTPGGTKVFGPFAYKFFDVNGNGRMDKHDVRLYDTGSGAAVECGTCHDPHGVPSGAPGSAFLPTFLRKTNTGSALCLTCHVK